MWKEPEHQVPSAGYNCIADSVAMVQLHIGIDDTDSTRGGCTTYIAARLVEKISKMKTRFIDYPNIIRLNPNIPYKTRGNAAVALRVDAERAHTVDAVEEMVLEEIERNSHIGHAGTDPAVVFLKGKPTLEVRRFANRALWDVMDENEAVKLITRSGASAASYGGSMIGLVGALAAVGQTLDADHTFELIAYREMQNCGKPRQVDENSVIRMDRLTSPKTFNNYDFQHRRMLITPHGPDPILFGIRGETPRVVLQAFQIVKAGEPVERWAIFRTNHGTDAHLVPPRKGNRLQPNSPAVLRGVVQTRPKIIPGGHIFFDLRYDEEKVQCAAFEPTGEFRDVVAKLLPGDVITAFGGVRNTRPNMPLNINLEKIVIHHVANKVETQNPKCSACGKRLESAGRGQGYRCERCSATYRNSKKIIVRHYRNLKPGVYLPALKAHRHLTKPICRYGHEKEKRNHQAPRGIWHEP